MHAVIYAYNNTYVRNRALSSRRSVRGKRIFFKYFPSDNASSPQTTAISAPSLPTSREKNKNKNFRKLLCHSRKIPSLHSPSSSLCFRFFPPPQWAPLAGAQTPLKEPRLWELACSGKRGGLRCVYAEASFPAHPLFRDWPPARGPHHPLLSL